MGSGASLSEILIATLPQADSEQLEKLVLLLYALYYIIDLLHLYPDFLFDCKYIRGSISTPSTILKSKAKAMRRCPLASKAFNTALFITDNIS